MAATPVPFLDPTVYNMTAVNGATATVTANPMIAGTVFLVMGLALAVKIFRSVRGSTNTR